MFVSDFAEMLADLPTAIVIQYAAGGTAPINAIVGDIDDGDDLQIAGVIARNSVEIFITRTDVATVPQAGDNVVIGGATYSVNTVSIPPDGTHVRMTCDGVSQ